MVLRRAVILLAAGASLAGAQGRVRVSGRVVDASTQLPVAGAEVLLAAPGDSARVLTAARGDWSASLDSGTTYTGRVRALGFRAATFDVTQATRTVALTPLPLALERMVVTAARREQRLADVVTTTEVLTGEEIARTGASDLGAALESAAGIQLDGGMPAGVGLMLQGLGSERVLILLDGQPLPGRIAGEFDIARLPTSSIERVEVVKGAQSTLYGTDAMGGVVNIITRKAVPGIGSASLSLIAGSMGRRDGTLALSHSVGPVAVRAEGGRRATATAPGRADERGAMAARSDATASVHWAADHRTSVEWNVAALNERQRWMSGAMYQFADNLQVTSRLAAEHRPDAGGTLRATAFGSVYDHLSRASALPQPIRGDTGQRQDQRLFQGELSYARPIGRHVLDAAVVARHDDTRSARIPGGRRALVTLEPWAQLEAALSSRLSLVSGARVTRSERWGTHFTPRVAARIRATQRLTVRASAGTGFRAPDFRELYLSFQNAAAGYAVYGNDGLRPERARNLMLGAEWAGSSAFVRAQTFHNAFRGFIEPRLISGPGEPPVYQYANVDDGYTRGAEVDAAVTPGRLRVEGGYAFLQARDRATDTELLGRATHTARASLSHPLPFRARGSLAALYTGRTPMRRDEQGVTSWRDAWPRFDVRLAQPLTRGVELAMNVQNVLDRRPAQWAGFTGRQGTVSLNWSAQF